MPGIGPPPNPNARRKNTRNGWRQLPKSGRQGPPPPWIFSDMSKVKELDVIWAELWSTPQAVAWEELGWYRTVARYTEMLLQSQDPDARDRWRLLSEVRQLEDRLGLNPLFLLRNQWLIVDDQEAPSEVANLNDFRHRAS